MSKTATETPSNGTAPAAAVESLDDLLAIDDQKIVPLYVPEWGKTVYVKRLGGVERDAVDASVVERDEDGRATVRHDKYRIALISACLVNAKGERLVVGDVARERLNQKSSAALQRIYEKAAEISAASKAAYEDLKGNSEGDTSTASLVA